MAEPRAESVLLSLSFTQDKITCMNESELNTVHAKIQKQHFKVKVTYSDTFLADFDSNPTINRNPILNKIIAKPCKFYGLRRNPLFFFLVGPPAVNFGFFRSVWLVELLIKNLNQTHQGSMVMMAIQVVFHWIKFERVCDIWILAISPCLLMWISSAFQEPVLFLIELFILLVLWRELCFCFFYCFVFKFCCKWCKEFLTC